MEENKFLENSKERTMRCLQDYSNDFIALEFTFKSSGIEGVRKLIKDGYKIPTVEDYLKTYRSENRNAAAISVEDEKDSFFIEKANGLNELANRINSLGENINEQVLIGTIEEVKNYI